MCKLSRNEILKLYKNLLMYGKELKYTNREYYKSRIRIEFKNNKEANEEEKLFLYERTQFIETEKACVICIIFPYKIMLRYFYEVLQIRASGQAIHTFLNPKTNLYLPLRQKWVIDKSKVPQLDEKDLKEKYVKGGGPGGSGVNKSVNCICLSHEPTGITIKCHETRSLEKNRQIARDRLIAKLDNLFNGEDSVESQKKRIEQEKRREKERRRKKRLQLKEKYRDSSSNIENNEKIL